MYCYVKVFVNSSHFFLVSIPNCGLLFMRLFCFLFRVSLGCVYSSLHFEVLLLVFCLGGFFACCQI